MALCTWSRPGTFVMALPTVHEMACFFVVLVAVEEVPAIMQFMFQQSMSFLFCASVQFLDRVSDIPVGYLVGDAQCAQDRGVPQVQFLDMVSSARCCATTGAVATLLAYAWLDSGYMFCVVTWVRCGRFSHNFYVKRYSDPEVDPASCSPLVNWRSMHSRCFDC